MKFRPYDVMEIAVYVINKTIDKGKPVNEPTLQNLLKQIQLTFVNLMGIKCFNGGEGLIDGEVKIFDVYEVFNRYTKRTIPYQESYNTLVVDDDLEVSYKTNYYCELVIREEDKKLIDTVIDKYIQKDNRVENIQDIIDLEDYMILMQYLALGNTITITNTMTDIEIGMSKEYTIEATYLEFDTLKYVYLDIDKLVRGVAPSINTKELTVCDIIHKLIPRLKLEEPLHKCDTRYNNRWEEIKYTTQKEINHIILKS